MTVKIHRYQVNTLTYEDREFELTHEPIEYEDPIVSILPDGRAVIGYLVQDQDCSNPLDDCDGMGKIYDRRRDSSREDRQAFYAAVGRDEDGNEDGQANPLAVLLDVYSHSGDCWRVHGGGRYFPDAQWDVCNCAGVWVPDKCCEEHIHYTAIKKLLPKGTDVAYKSTYHKDGTVKTLNIITCTLPDGRVRRGYKTFTGAIMAAAKALGVKLDKEKLAEKQREVAVECAGQAVETFNDWLSGQCFGVVVETYDAAGEPVDEDSCWGHIGFEYAQEEVQSEVKSTVASLTKDSA